MNLRLKSVGKSEAKRRKDSFSLFPSYAPSILFQFTIKFPVFSRRQQAFFDMVYTYAEKRGTICPKAKLMKTVLNNVLLPRFLNVVNNIIVQHHYT